MIARRFAALTESVGSKLRTRETVAVETPTALAISLSVTIDPRLTRRPEPHRLAQTRKVRGGQFLPKAAATLKRQALCVNLTSISIAASASGGRRSTLHTLESR